MYVTFDKCVFHFQLNLYLNILISWEERLGLKAIFHNCHEHVHLYVSYSSVKNHAPMIMHPCGSTLSPTVHSWVRDCLNL